MNSFLIKNTDINYGLADKHSKKIDAKRNGSFSKAQTLITKDGSPLTGKRKSIVASKVYTVNTYGKVKDKRPQARDGHTGVIHDKYFFVFGGDRHHMPFNDVFMLHI